MSYSELARLGFVYEVETVRRGVVIDREVIHNLAPIEGLSYICSALFKSATVPASWYIGLFEGNYAPQATDTAALFVAAATECTAYVETTREAFVAGTVTSGQVNNNSSPAEFTSSANKTIYGGFMSSSGPKSSTTGALLSIVRFTTPKTFDIDTVLRVRAGFTFTSV